MDVRPVVDADRAWIAAQIEAAFGSVRMVSRGHLFEDTSRLDGLIVPDGGVVLLSPGETDAEVVVLVAARKRAGVGRALLAAAAELGRTRGWQRLWLVTTNNNLEGIAFYQSVGWDLVALHRDAVTKARRLKPEIPERADNGIPIRHELEFALQL